MSCKPISNTRSDNRPHTTVTRNKNKIQGHVYKTAQKNRYKMYFCPIHRCEERTACYAQISKNTSPNKKSKHWSGFTISFSKKKLNDWTCQERNRYCNQISQQ